VTKVDFYLLGQDGDSREIFACRLIDKAWRLGHRVYLLVPDEPAAVELDDLLWTFSQGSFVPHAVYRQPADAEAHPVLIGNSEPPEACHDVLVSLAADVPPWFSRFTRVAEVVAADDEQKSRARDRFRYYRERGYPLETHNL